jgi:hypothetical protein
MSKLWNLLFTVFFLAVAYVITIAVTHDGSSSFADHFGAFQAWFWIVLVLYFPHILIVGAVIFYVNDAVYRAFVRTRTRRWLEKAGVED